MADKQKITEETMDIIIIGCGKVGTTLAEQLVREDLLPDCEKSGALPHDCACAESDLQQRAYLYQAAAGNFHDY